MLAIGKYIVVCSTVVTGARSVSFSTNNVIKSAAHNSANIVKMSTPA